MMSQKRFYLDNAATSWPKPATVIDSIAEFYERSGVSLGRSSGSLSAELTQRVYQVRKNLAGFLGADFVDELMFTFSGTDSLNLAVRGLLRPGQHVVTTVIEHNSLLRPLQFLQGHHGIQVTQVRCDARGWVDPEEIACEIRPETRLVAISDAGNVTGKRQSLGRIGEICRERQVLFLVDAAQTLGYHPLDVNQIRADVVCAPGHKGLSGPLGTGIAYLRKSIQQQMLPWRLGGTGTTSDSLEQPGQGTEKFESGNLNSAGILALGAGLDWIQRTEYREKLRHWIERTEQLRQQLIQIPGIQVIGEFDPQVDVPILSLICEAADCHEFATILDTSFGIQCRAGLHCAPLIHGFINTGPQGTIRLSPSVEFDQKQMEYVVGAIRKVASSMATMG